MTTWETVKEAVAGAAAFFRFREKQGDRLNTEEMRANAEAALRQKIKDDAARAVRENDLDEIRKRGG